MCFSSAGRKRRKERAEEKDWVGRNKHKCKAKHKQNGSTPSKIPSELLGGDHMGLIFGKQLGGQH